MTRAILVALAAITTPLAAQHATEAEAREMRLALAAAPAHLRNEAEVRVLRNGAYILARRGTNGFTCLVEHEDPRTSEPVCYDPAGSAAFLPVASAREAWRRSGMAEAEIRKQVSGGFTSGRFRAPDRPGLAYMLSPEQTVVDEASGQVVPFVPHLMFYAPNLTARELGLESPEVAAPANRPFLVFERDPRGLIIVPLGPHH